MKTRRLALLLAAALLALPGCAAFPERNPIEKMQNILVAGVDIENGKIRLTVVVDKFIGGKAGEVKVGTQVYSDTGDTVFEANRALQANTEKHVFWQHLKYIVIGEEAAKTDIKEVLDFFSENYGTRFTNRLMVAKGMSAYEFFIKVITTQGGVWNEFESLFKETEKTGQSSLVRLLDYARNYESAWSDPFIPTVQAIPSVQINNTQDKGESQEPAYLPKLGGYALFRNNRLAGYLDGRQALGLNIVINKLKNAEITVTDIRGQRVSLEILKSKADIKTDLGDMPSANIRVVIESYLFEYHETAGVTKDEYIKYIEGQQNNYIQSVIAQSLSEAQRCGADVFGIGDALYHAHPADSKKIRDLWKELYPEMSIPIQVESTIISTYNMRDSMGN